MGVVDQLFFFSSRRRHTSYIGDWSSDVCSSDLLLGLGIGEDGRHLEPVPELKVPTVFAYAKTEEQRQILQVHASSLELRSEERRVGKGGAARNPGTTEEQLR